MAVDKGQPSVSDPISRILAGWQPARVLMAANRLGFFNALGEENLTAEELAQRCGTHPRGTTRLLNACVALGLLTKEGSRYHNTPAALELLVKGRPTYMGDAINHADWLWRVWTHLDEVVRTDKPVSPPWQATGDLPVHYDFIMAMHNRALRAGPLLAEALDLSGRRQLFDAGGGPGTYSIFLAKRYPGLRAIVFDLPETIEIARKIIAEAGLSDRITTQPGDYFRDDFSQENDVVLFSAIFHSMGHERARLLLKKAYAALVPGGLVVVHEGLIDPEGTSPLPAVLFSLNMLVNTREGHSYSGPEVGSLLEKAGFVQPQVKPLPSPARTSLVIAVKP